MGRGEFVERCPSGIPGFDNICQGGFVRNSANALLGGPGAGKTIFLLQFLYSGAVDYKENGLYLSFEPDIVEIYKDAATFGWDFQKLDSADKVKLYKVSPQSSVAELKKDLTKLVSKYDIKRVCFDPIGLFQANETSEAKLRVMLFDLVSLLKRLNVTVLIADEVASMEGEGSAMFSGGAKSEFVKFLVDGIVDIYSSGLGGVGDRAVRISKMRRTNHQRGPIPMQLNDSGISVISRGRKGI